MFHLNTFFMGLRPFEIFGVFSQWTRAERIKQSTCPLPAIYIYIYIKVIDHVATMPYNNKANRPPIRIIQLVKPDW